MEQQGRGNRRRGGRYSARGDGGGRGSGWQQDGRGRSAADRGRGFQGDGGWGGRNDRGRGRGNGGRGGGAFTWRSGGERGGRGSPAAGIAATPVFYASLVAYRGRLYYEAVLPGSPSDIILVMVDVVFRIILFFLRSFRRSQLPAR